MKNKIIYTAATLSVLSLTSLLHAGNGEIDNGLTRNGIANGAVAAPDGGSTLWLLGIALTGMVMFLRKRSGRSS